MLSNDDLEVWCRYLSHSSQPKATLLLQVQIDASLVYLHRQRIWLLEIPLNNMVLFCCVALHSWNAGCIIHAVPLPVIWGGGGGWNDLRWRSVYRNPPRSLPLLFLLFSYRKHALNCHRMKPALFSVLCEIKEKTGEFLLHSFLLCSQVC